MSNLEFLFETAKQMFFRDFFEGEEIIFIQEKRDPNEIYLSAESTAKIAGYKSAEEMFKSDEFLDKLNEYMKCTGNPFPMKNINVDNNYKS